MSTCVIWKSHQALSFIFVGTSKLASSQMQKHENIWSLTSLIIACFNLGVVMLGEWRQVLQSPNQRSHLGELTWFILFTMERVQDHIGALFLAVREHVRWHWRSQACPSSFVLVFEGGGVAISGFFLRFALVSREVADGTAFVLALQLWPWRSDDGGLWINLTTTLCLCVCICWFSPSLSGAESGSGISNLPWPLSLSLWSKQWQTMGYFPEVQS